jgi:hypothetical protein
MYSSTCHANWAEADGTVPGVVIWVTNAINESENWTIHSGYTYGWTNMVDGYPQAWACLQAPDSGVGPLCTPKA